MSVAALWVLSVVVRVAFRERDIAATALADRPGGYGLGNMRRRADALVGRLDIQSGPGGTTVTLDLPAEIRGAAPA